MSQLFSGQSLKLNQLFRNVTVYIRRLTSGERPPEQDPTDPDFDGYVNGIKRFKTGNGHFIPNSSPCSDFVRRSNRRQKVRGERELTVSSDMLLRDLKVKVRKPGRTLGRTPGRTPGVHLVEHLVDHLLKQLLKHLVKSL